MRIQVFLIAAVLLTILSASCIGVSHEISRFGVLRLRGGQLERSGQYTAEEYEKVRAEVTDQVQREVTEKLEHERKEKEHERRRSRNKARKRFKKEKGQHVPSTKNRIRSMERTLERRSDRLTDESKQQIQEKLKVLRQEYEDVKLSLTEREMAKKYRKVKFWERKKLQRKLSGSLRKLESLQPGSEQHGQVQEQVRRLQEDLEYVVYFPRDMKYVSILQNPPEVVAELRSSPEFQQKQQRAREIVLAYRASKLKQKQQLETQRSEEEGEENDDTVTAGTNVEAIQLQSVKKSEQNSDSGAASESDEGDAKRQLQWMREEQQRNLAKFEAGEVPEDESFEEHVLANVESEDDDHHVEPDDEAESSVEFFDPKQSQDRMEDEDEDETEDEDEDEDEDEEKASKKAIGALKGFLGDRADSEDSTEKRKRERSNAAENFLYDGDLITPVIEKEEKGDRSGQQEGGRKRGRDAGEDTANEKSPKRKQKREAYNEGGSEVAEPARAAVTLESPQSPPSQPATAEGFMSMNPAVMATLRGATPKREPLVKQKADLWGTSSSGSGGESTQEMGQARTSEQESSMEAEEMVLEDSEEHDPAKLAAARQRLKKLKRAALEEIRAERGVSAPGGSQEDGSVDSEIDAMLHGGVPHPEQHPMLNRNFSCLAEAVGELSRLHAEELGVNLTKLEQEDDAGRWEDSSSGRERESESGDDMFEEAGRDDAEGVVRFRPSQAQPSPDRPATPRWKQVGRGKRQQRAMRGQHAEAEDDLEGVGQLLATPMPPPKEPSAGRAEEKEVLDGGSDNHEEADEDDAQEAVRIRATTPRWKQVGREKRRQRATAKEQEEETENRLEGIGQLLATPKPPSRAQSISRAQGAQQEQGAVQEQDGHPVTTPRKDLAARTPLKEQEAATGTGRQNGSRMGGQDITRETSAVEEDGVRVETPTKVRSLLGNIDTFLQRAQQRGAPQSQRAQEEGEIVEVARAAQSARKAKRRR